MLLIPARSCTGGRPKREVAARSKEEEWARAAGVNYSIPRWASLDRERTPKKAKRWAAGWLVATSVVACQRR